MGKLSLDFNKELEKIKNQNEFKFEVMEEEIRQRIELDKKKEKEKKEFIISEYKKEILNVEKTIRMRSQRVIKREVTFNNYTDYEIYNRAIEELKNIKSLNVHKNSFWYNEDDDYDRPRKAYGIISVIISW